MIVLTLKNIKQTLRQLYVDCVRLTLEYSSAALSTATHTQTLQHWIRYKTKLRGSSVER